MKKALLVIDMQNVCVGERHAKYFKYNGNTDTGLPYLNGNSYEIGLLLGYDKEAVTEQEKALLIPTSAFETTISTTLAVTIGENVYYMGYSEFSVCSLAQYYVDNLSENSEVADYLGVLQSVNNN